VPAWSPDGSRISFTRAFFDQQTGSLAQSIYVMHADGSNQIKFANNGGEIDYNPAWSPDGTQIAWARFPNDGQHGPNLFLAQRDGTNMRNLTNDYSISFDGPQWSPDGSKLSFLSAPNNGSYALSIIKPDGSGRTTVSGAVESISFNKGWSPDGAKLAFTVSYGEVYNGLYIVNADGTGLTHIGDDLEHNDNPTWSPDSSQLAFNSARNSQSSIDIVNADGTHRVDLTNAPGNFYAAPKWRPHPRGNTPAGANVTLAVNGVALNFANVTTAGQTTVTQIDPNSLQGVPGEYVINANSLAFEIHTTATYTGPITLGFQVPGVNNSITFSALRVLHGEPPPVPNFVDRTVLAPDTPAPNFATRIIYARVTSLSPFLVAERKETVPPVTTAALSAQPNAAGWHKANVTVTLTATDNAGGSGVQSIIYSATGAQPIAQTTVNASTAAVTITSEGTTTINYRARDAYGNVESFKSVTIKLDKTAPAINITAPTATVYTIGRAVTASFQCTDTVSGPSSCAGSVANGAALNTASVGAQTFTVNAADTAGNTAQKSVSYKVAYGINPQFDQTKANKSGSTIPIKLELVDAAGVNRSAANIVVTAIGIVQVSNNAPGVLQDPGNSNPDFNFRYAGGQYQFNLKTTGYAAGTYRLDFQVAGDPVMHSVQFQIK
jgi:Tol biopolymer transport system component